MNASDLSILAFEKAQPIAQVVTPIDRVLKASTLKCLPRFYAVPVTLNSFLRAVIIYRL